MGKVVLTEDQIKELRYYIYKRGFRDPVVVNEILDHFACKVEELLGNEDIDLKTTMHKAHLSFGYSGFHPISVNLEVSLERKYKFIYRNECKRLLKSIPFMFLLISTAVALYFSYLLTASLGWYFWDSHSYLGIFLILVYLAARFYVTFIIIPKEDKENMYMIKASKPGYDIIMWFIILFSNGKITGSELRLKVTAFAIAVLAIVAIIQIIAKHKTIKTALNDIANFKSLSTV